jgi:hypothetical protein
VNVCVCVCVIDSMSHKENYFIKRFTPSDILPRSVSLAYGRQASAQVHTHSTCAHTGALRLNAQYIYTDKQTYKHAHKHTPTHTHTNAHLHLARLVTGGQL